MTLKYYYLSDISKTDDINQIVDIINCNLKSSRINFESRSKTLRYLIPKDDSIKNTIFNEYFKDEKCFEFTKAYNFVGHNRDVISYNYYYIKFLLSINKIDWYIDFCKGTNSFINLSVLIYYYIINDMDKGLNLIEEIYKDKFYKYSIGTEKTILNKIISNLISIHNIKSYYNNDINNKIVNLLKLSLFGSLTPAQKIDVFRRLHIENDELYKQLIDDTKVTSSQFLLVNKLETPEKIDLYIKTLSYSTKWINTTDFILKGLKRMKYSHELYLYFFIKLFENNIISRNNSSDIFCKLLEYNEFVLNNKASNSNNNLDKIYSMFLLNGTNIRMINTRIDFLKNWFIYSVYTNDTYFCSRYNFDRHSRYEFTSIYINGLDRKCKVSGLINKIKNDESKEYELD